MEESIPWDDIARAEHNRDHLRFPSDLTDPEWALIAPMIPPSKRGGRPRTTQMRDVVEAISFVVSSGCQWRMLPGDFPPVSTVRGTFYRWRNAGLLETINQLLVIAAREIDGKEAQPTAGVIDSHPSNGKFCASIQR
jgi:putative transposase